MSNKQTGGLQIHLCDVSGCLHSPEILIWVGNNNFISFHSVNCDPQDTFSAKITKWEWQETPHFVLSDRLPPDAPNRSRPTSGKDQAACQPDTAETVTWERETLCDLMIQPEVKAERTERPNALTFERTAQSNWMRANVSYKGISLGNTSQARGAVKRQRWVGMGRWTQGGSEPGRSAVCVIAAVRVRCHERAE